MNQKSKNSVNYNMQSTVMSFIIKSNSKILPNNNIQLICTGDAENYTFELIKKQTGGKNSLFHSITHEINKYVKLSLFFIKNY